MSVGLPFASGEGDEDEDEDEDVDHDHYFYYVAAGKLSRMRQSNREKREAARHEDSSRIFGKLAGVAG